MSQKPHIPVDYTSSAADHDQYLQDIMEKQAEDHKKALKATFDEEKQPKSSVLVANQEEIPLNISLLLELRRVRQTILPAYFSQYYVNEHPSNQTDVFKSIAIIQGTLSAAETAMMNQDFFGMLAAHHQLKSFQLATTPEPDTWREGEELPF
jgi:hypothetical protein